MSNKVNNKLDFRNIKKTQFDSAQTLKLSFSELQSALRTFPTNAIIKDGYTHFVQTLNADDLPTHVVYWQANKPFISQLTLRADVNGDLRDTYILMEEYLTKRTIALYCVVDGTGTAPGIADLEVAVTFNENDSAAIVTYAFLNAINNNLDYFEASRVGSISSTNKIDIKFLQFGKSSPINVGTTGFTTQTIQSGESFKVGEVFLDYDVNGYPIYNGNTLKGLLYNPYSGTFDVERDRITVDVESPDLVSSEPSIQTLEMPVAGTEYNFDLPIGTKRFKVQIRDHVSPYTVSFTSGGLDYWTKSYGSTFEENDLDVIDAHNTVYVTAKKNNVILEILTWK